MNTNTTNGIVSADGVLSGPYRQPPNVGGDRPGNIHNGEVALKLGFRGGPVGGPTMMDQFPPLMLKAFGQQWFERGALACYFREAVIEGEDVRAGMQQPTAGDDTQVDIWIEARDGSHRVTGSASLGKPSTKSLVAERFAKLGPAGDLRILGHVEVGWSTPERPAIITLEEAVARKANNTDPLDWQFGESPWGGPIATPSQAYMLMQPYEFIRPLVPDSQIRALGASDIRMIDGPIMLDRQYLATSTWVGLGQTPKTEYIWIDSSLKEADTGKLVATMLTMTRWMKAASPAYAGVAS